LGEIPVEKIVDAKAAAQMTLQTAGWSL